MNFYRVSASATSLSLPQAITVQKKTTQHLSASTNLTSPTALSLPQATTVQKVTSLLSAQQLISSTNSTLQQPIQVRVSDEDIKNIEEIIQNSEDFEYYPPISEILQTARLVYGGYIATIKHLKLGYINLNQIPPQHLTTLASCATERVSIIEVEGDLSNVIKSAKCEQLNFSYITLDANQTMLLVEAVQDRIQQLIIGPDVLLDFDLLQNYDGLGKCWLISVYCTPSEPHRFKSNLEGYGKKLGWKTEIENIDSEDYLFNITREMYI